MGKKKRKLTLRVARLLTVCTVIRDFFMVAPVNTNNHVRLCTVTDH